jgi:hypothetical protein
MNDERDEILDDVRALISIEPAPGFEARVQGEVQNRAASRSRAWWMGTAALAGATAVIALVTGARPTPDREPRTAVATASPTPPVSSVTAAPQPAMAVRVRATTSTVSSPPKTSEPEVLVPPDQAIALERLVADIKGGRLVLAPIAGDDTPVEIRPLPAIEPVKIEPLAGEGTDSKLNTDSREVEAYGSIQA